MSDKGPETKFELLALGDMYAAYGGQRIALKIANRNGTKADFMREIAEASRTETLATAADRLLGIDSRSDLTGYSITRALKAAMERNHSLAPVEYRVSDLTVKNSGLVPNGDLFAPLGLLARDFNAGTAAEAGNLMDVKTPYTAGVLNDPLRKVSAIGRLGATILPGVRYTLDVPRFEASGAVGWQAETGTSSTILTTTSNLSLTPKRSSVTMILSRQALLQATPALDAVISRHLVGALMEKAEDGGLNDDGTSNSPLGLRSTPGIGNVVGGTDGALLTYAHLCDLEDKPALANAEETDFSGFIINSKTRRYLRTCAEGSGLPYIWKGNDRPLLGHRAAVSNLLPSNLVKGFSGAVCSSLLYSSDWSQMLFVIYGGGIDLTVDRVTLAAEGKVRIVATIMAGIGSALPGAFSKMDDAKLA